MMLSSRKNLDFLKDFPSQLILEIQQSKIWNGKNFDLKFFNISSFLKWELFLGNNFIYMFASLLWESPMQKWTQNVCRKRKILSIKPEFLGNIPFPGSLEPLRISRKIHIKWVNTTNILADGCTTPGGVFLITTPQKKSLFAKIILNKFQSPTFLIWSRISGSGSKGCSGFGVLFAW